MRRWAAVDRAAYYNVYRCDMVTSFKRINPTPLTVRTFDDTGYPYGVDKPSGNNTGAIAGGKILPRYVAGYPAPIDQEACFYFYNGTMYLGFYKDGNKFRIALPTVANW